MTTVYEHWKQVPRTWSAWPWRYFVPKEMACRGTGKLSVNDVFINKLDILRSRFGRPLIVLSAFRTPYHNAFVGGAVFSLHLKALAVDLSIVGQDKKLIKQIAKEEDFTGFGYYNTFLHIDLGRKREWGKWDA